MHEGQHERDRLGAVLAVGAELVDVVEDVALERLEVFHDARVAGVFLLQRLDFVPHGGKAEMPIAVAYLRVSGMACPTCEERIRAALLRLNGNWLETFALLPVPANLGTPGLPNSRALPNIGPAIVDVRHNPVLPTASQAVVVSARVHDPDGLSAVLLKYRVDPATNYTSVAMSYSGAGFYSATIPGQVSGALAAFFIEAKDAPAAWLARPRAIRR